VRAFAASEDIKAKTDPMDAKVLLRFAQEKKPRATPAPERFFAIFSGSMKT
jgi:transposase